MHCIVCDRSAEGIEPQIRNAQAVRCSHCGDYDVSETSAAALARMEPYARLQALRYAQANAQAGRRPFIHGVA